MKHIALLMEYFINFVIIIKNFFPNENEWLPCTEEYFYKNKSSGIDGLHPYCKKCAIKKSGDRQKVHRDEANEYHYAYCLERPDYHRNIVRKYENKNKKTRKESIKKWRQENKDKIKEYGNKYSNKKHIINNNEWENCKNYFNNSCAYCGISEDEAIEKYNQKFHKEHVNHEGTNDLSNCVPSCKGCNCSKHTDNMEEWYVKQDFFSQVRLDKINKWINKDYKLHIEEKIELTYIICRIKNNDNKTYHFELWSKDENDNKLECLAIENKKKDLNQYIEEYYNNF